MPTLLSSDPQNTGTQPGVREQATGSLDSCRAELRQMWDSAMVEGRTLEEAAWGKMAGPLGWQPQSRAGSHLPCADRGWEGWQVRLLADLLVQVSRTSALLRGRRKEERPKWGARWVELPTDG